MSLSAYQSKRFRVGLLVQTSSHWSREILAGVGAYAREQGGWEFYAEPRGFHEPLRLCDDLQVDGVICRLTDEVLAASIASKGIPAINVAWLGSQFEQFPRVISDEIGCAKMAAVFFRDKGYRSFGFVGPQASLGYTSTVENTFIRELEEQREGVHCRVYPAYDCTDLSTQRDTMTAWLRRLPKPAALLLWNTQVARLVIDVCIGTKLIVPDDVAVLAIEHDSLLSSLSPYPISYIEQLPHEVGYQAAKRLHLRMLGQPDDDRAWLISPLGVTQHVSTDTRFATDDVVRQAVKAIDDHFAEDLNVARLADELDISRRSLEYRFRKSLRRSPAEHLRRVRLRRVQQLLGSTDLSVEQIAFASGFKHPAAMIRTFKRELGVTPTQYRRQA